MKRTQEASSEQVAKRSKPEPKPIPLVQVNETGQYYMPEEGKAALEMICAPFSMVGIVGAYRGGKSFLMNALRASHGRYIQFLQNQKQKSAASSLPIVSRSSEGDGFQVDSSTNACTKG